MLKNKVIFSINRRQIVTLSLAWIAIGTTSNCFFGSRAIAQQFGQGEIQPKPIYANVNEVKSFIYSWFALLDRQVSEISLFKFLAKDNLTMQLPETIVDNREDFSQWYLDVQRGIVTNTHDVRELEVIPRGNGEYDVQLQVDWQGKTLEGEIVKRAYQQQWKVVTDKDKRLLIQEYLVEEI